MILQSVHQYGRFFLGILVGVVILSSLWYGSGFKDSATPEEITVRIFCIYGGSVGFVAISLIAIVSRVVPVFYSSSRRSEPSFFTTGLIVSVAINGLFLIISDVTKIPFFGDL